MDQRERNLDLLEAIKMMLDGFQSGIWTAMPGIIDEYDASKNWCKVTIAVKSRILQRDGSLKSVTIPQLLDCPVNFQHGGGFTTTYPLKPGDECLVVFAARCIDAPIQSGGVQEQAESRMHDLSDGFVIPGYFSLPKVPAAISSDSVQMRSDDGLAYVEIKEGHIANIKAPGGITLDAGASPLVLISAQEIDMNTPTVIASGDVAAAGEGTFGPHTVGNHTHTQPNDGDGDSEAPTNTPLG